jgi:hypothetical protein
MQSMVDRNVVKQCMTVYNTVLTVLLGTVLCGVPCLKCFPGSSTGMGGTAGWVLNDFAVLLRCAIILSDFNTLAGNQSSDLTA